MLYEATESGGLYIRAESGRIAQGEELTYALERHNQLRGERYDKYPLPREYYEGDSAQKMWVADSETFWINGSTKDLGGAIVQDHRFEIARQSLII